jgi:CelD/BcsL family acetyltransferase involved in cellulose biosynthesis
VKVLHHARTALQGTDAGGVTMSVEGMAETAVRRPVGRAGALRVEFVRDWREASARWRERQEPDRECGQEPGATVFQHRHWLDAWYPAFGSDPLVAFVLDGAGRDLALIPLALSRKAGLRVVEFADLGVSDYNAPVFASDAPRDPAGLRAVGTALLDALRSLPERPDLVLLEKMPLQIRGRINPLATDGRATPCALTGNMVEFDDDFEHYRASIAKLQLPRRWRVFARNPGARFEMIADVGEALRILDAMDAQQNRRMKELGERFVLDDPVHAAFYRDVVARGLKDGYAVISALICGEEIVATTYGLRTGAHYSLLRNTNAGEHWSNCSPSQLCIERTMAALHAQGVRHFDLSIGTYDYKRRFGAVPVALTDLRIPLTWRAMPEEFRTRAIREIKRHPKLVAQIKRAMGAAAAARRLWSAPTGRPAT